MSTRSHPPRRLTRDTPVEDLYEYYWLKQDLVDFAVANGIPATGRKLAIRDRIAAVLRGEKPARSGTGRAAPRTRDSDRPLTLETPVVVFKSDQKTREWFISQIGPQFHFTAHLNDYMRGRDDLTYGDLVVEWLDERERRRDPNYRPPIMRSCEYNQFVRDYYADPRNAGRRMPDVVAAWNTVKQRRGPRVYRPEEFQ